jgi:hypothetical protein
MRVFNTSRVKKVLYTTGFSLSRHHFGRGKTIKKPNECIPKARPHPPCFGHLLPKEKESTTMDKRALLLQAGSSNYWGSLVTLSWERGRVTPTAKRLRLKARGWAEGRGTTPGRLTTNSPTTRWLCRFVQAQPLDTTSLELFSILDRYPG